MVEWRGLAPHQQVDEKVQQQIEHRAKLTVCREATSVEDARILLDMLGLVEDSVRFPSVPVSYRGVHGAPSPGASGALPASGYGSGIITPPA